MDPEDRCYRALPGRGMINSSCKPGWDHEKKNNHSWNNWTLHRRHTIAMRKRMTFKAHTYSTSVCHSSEQSCNGDWCPEKKCKAQCQQVPRRTASKKVESCKEMKVTGPWDTVNIYFSSIMVLVIRIKQLGPCARRLPKCSHQFSWSAAAELKGEE